MASGLAVFLGLSGFSMVFSRDSGGFPGFAKGDFLCWALLEGLWEFMIF